VKAQPHNTITQARIGVVSLLLLLGLTAPSFHKLTGSSIRVPFSTEQEFSIRNTTHGTFRISFKNHSHFTPHAVDSFLGIALHHANNCTLSWQISNSHLLPQRVKLGSHQKLSEDAKGLRYTL
jgi:hypothetical protein